MGSERMNRIERVKSIGLALAGCALFAFFIFTIVRVSRTPPEQVPFPDAATHATRKDTTAVADTLDPRRAGD